MGWLRCFGVWSCVLLARCAALDQLGCEGLNGCERVSTLEVYRGDTQSLNLSLNETWQKLVKKWDPETKTWEEEILNGLGKDNSLTDKTPSISLVNGNFTVRNAEKAEEGLYKIERYLDNSCLAVVNVLVQDLPLPVTVMPSFDLSSSIQGERKRRSPPMDRKLVEKQEAKGLNGCVSSFTLEVLRGDSRSLNLSLNETWQKLVKKWDPETKTWEEEILNGLGKDNSLMGKTSSISLVNGHFTVRNAEKREEGLYKIERYLDNSCLAVVNVLVQDLPLPVTVMPSFDLSSTITSKVTETPEASPPGRDDTAVYVAAFVSAGIIIAVFFLVRKWIKSKRRPDGAASDVDPEKCMNGSQSPQQEESTTT